jgi:cupin superfamily acireductone dioxygenase involved in methionine salvage
MKRIGIIFLILLTTGFITGFYYWRQATTLPTWYAKQATTANITNTRNRLSIQQTTEKIKAEIAASTQQVANNKDIELQLDENELNNLLASEIIKKNNKSQLAQAVKAVKTEIENGKLKSGAIVNISDISTAQLGKSEVAELTKLIKAFPTLEDREVYLGIEGKPIFKSGQLRFDENSTIKVGNLSFTQAELSEKLGIPENKIKQFTKFQLQIDKLKVNDIELNDKKALLRGSVN